MNVLLNLYLMNQDQEFLTKNLRNMCDYIRQETDKKAGKIRKDAQDEANLRN
jgi:hypothetical protein